jgi:hypothetical protein
MGPILPVNIGSAGSPYAPTPIPERAGCPAGSALSSGLGLDAVQGGGLTSSLANVSAAVSELFKAIGGSVENDQTLRLLIVLLILMALLQKPQTDGATANTALDQLGNGANGGSQFISMVSSSTTIAIQQSSTTIVSANLDGSSLPSKPEVPPVGSQIDVVS